MIFFKSKKSQKLEVLKNSNIDYNKNLWNKYAEKWTKQNAEVEDHSINEAAKNEYLEYLGDEWGDKKSVKEVIHDYILPFIDQNSHVAEIGCGGGRIAAQVAPEVKGLVCFDISEEMIRRAQKNLIKQTNVQYILSNGSHFDESFKGKFDFVYSFDVFVHLDLHTIWSYFREIRKILKKDGFVFLHTTNLAAPDGWSRFEKQVQFKVEGHYFIVPEIIRVFAEKANYEIIKESKSSDNFYYNRDYLFILKNKE